MKVLQTRRQRIVSWFLLALYGAIVLYWMWTGYLRSDATFVAGLAVLLLATVVRQEGVGSGRFALPALLCIGLGLAVPARTFHFMALVFAAIFVFENLKGKINESPVLIAFLLTAVVKTMSIILGFALRLELSQHAAASLRLLGHDARAEGNIIWMEGRDFSVDPACMGLQMVEISFLFCFFLLGLFERRTGRYLSLPVLGAVVLVVAALNLIFNQLRIIFLVLFNIVPGNPMHDVAGLAGLALYVFVPVWFGLRRLYGSKVARIAMPSTTVAGCSKNQNKARPVRLVLYFLFTAFLLYFAINATGKYQENPGLETAIVPGGLPAGCRIESLQDGVVKYSNDSLLVYVKPIPGWYSTEHTPLICWRGSGYEFGKVWEQKTGETTCYAGILEKKTEPALFTAWWFDNGREQTIAQARWRWLDAGGAPGFSLVNVTARDRQTLENQIHRMLKR